ncbi:hypothetical protein C8Q75DRAFT_730280 [Abortiporus biennis]|nr:hypothetical protein C8Q75DRAFT_730280 [Abortiporus biennis]
MFNQRWDRDSYCEHIGCRKFNNFKYLLSRGPLIPVTRKCKLSTLGIWEHIPTEILMQIFQHIEGDFSFVGDHLLGFGEYCNWTEEMPSDIFTWDDLLAILLDYDLDIYTYKGTTPVEESPRDAFVYSIEKKWSKPFVFGHRCLPPALQNAWDYIVHFDLDYTMVLNLEQLFK